MSLRRSEVANFVASIAGKALSWLHKSISNRKVIPVLRRHEIMRHHIGVTTYMTDHDKTGLSLKIAELREAAAILQLRIAMRKFDPNQPRWLAGNPSGWGGRWRGEGDAILVASKIDRQREQRCEEQYVLDAQLCRMSASRLCWESAMVRKGACLTGSYIPPLRH